MTKKDHRNSTSGCGCPGLPEDEAFEASAWAVGIDVSHHNGNVNWLTVKNAGYSFVFLKATEGATYTDNTFARNRDRAAATEFFVGAYHFFRPTTSSAEDQARNFVRAVGSLRHNELPPVLDIEDASLWKNVSSDAAFKMVKTWNDAVQSALGVRPIIYASPSFVKDVLENNPGLAEFALWLAHYTTAQSPNVPAPWTRWTFWQHSESGRVPGVSTNCDLNRFNGTVSELSNMARKTAAPMPSSTRWYYAWLRFLMRIGL